MFSNNILRRVLVLVLVFSIMAVPAFAATKVSGKDLSKTGSSLDDFEFEIDGDRIELKEYKGTETEVRIEASYNFNNRTYKTDLSRFMFGIFNDYPNRAFIAEGIEELYGPIFNSCKVYEFYLPKSLKSLDPKVLSYFPHYDSSYNVVVSKLFYGGTQEEFEALLIKGAGMSPEEGKDINVYAGFGFDASALEFIFEATEEDFYSGEF